MNFKKIFKKSGSIAASVTLIFGLFVALNVETVNVSNAEIVDGDFWYITAYETDPWIVPVKGSYLIEIWGGKGGTGYSSGGYSGGAGGLGGYVKGTISLSSNEILYPIKIGNPAIMGSGAGGAAFGLSLSNDSSDLSSYLGIAAGGGGGGSNYINVNGGKGGGLKGGNGDYSSNNNAYPAGTQQTTNHGYWYATATGGTQESGGKGERDGQLFIGGAGRNKAGSGGSGYYGGGSGYSGDRYNGAGAGGSSYISNLLENSMTQSGVNSGDNSGYNPRIKITLVEKGLSQVATITSPSYKTSTISWPILDDPSIIGYRVTASGLNQSDRVVEVGSTVGSVTFNNLNSNVSWSFKIEILTNDGVQEMEKEDDVPVIFDDELTSPSLILDNSTVSWNPVPGAIEYQVTYYDQNGIVNTQRTSSTSMTIPSGQSISVSPVSSTGSVGQSSYSTPGISSSSSPGRVGGESSGGSGGTGGSGSSGNSILPTVSWASVNGASSYRVTVYPSNGQNPQYITVTDPEFTVENGSIIAVSPIIDGAPGQEIPIGVPGQQVNLGNGDVLITWPLFPSSLITGYRVTAYATGAEDIVKETDAYTDHVLFKSLDQSKDWNFTIQLLMGDDTGPEMDLGLFNYKTEPSFINGILNNDDGMVNMYVTSELTLTLEDDSVDLSDIPGLTTITPDNTMIANVRTNNITGFNVTLKSDTETLQQSNQQNTDILEFSNIKAWDENNIDNTFSLSTSGDNLYSSDSRTDDSGELITTGFSAEIPWINADTYTGTVTYTATAN